MARWPVKTLLLAGAVSEGIAALGFVSMRLEYWAASLGESGGSPLVWSISNAFVAAAALTLVVMGGLLLGDVAVRAVRGEG